MTTSYGDPKSGARAAMYARGATASTGAMSTYDSSGARHVVAKSNNSRKAGEPEPLTSTGQPFGGQVRGDNKPGSASQSRRDGSDGQKRAQWLVRMYELVASDQMDDALDLVVDTVDDRLLGEDFEQVNQSLREVDIERLDTNLIVGWLAITRPARENLSARASFVEKAESRLNTIAPGRVEELIGGLR